MADVSSKTKPPGTKFIRCPRCRIVYDDLASFKSHMRDHALANKKCPHCCVQLLPTNSNNGDEFYFDHLTVCNKLPRIFASEKKNLSETKAKDAFQGTSNSSSPTKEPKKFISELLGQLHKTKVQLPGPSKRTLLDEGLVVNKQCIDTSRSVSAIAKTGSSSMGSSGGGTPKKMKLTESKNCNKINSSENQNSPRVNCGNLSIDIYKVSTTGITFKTQGSPIKNVSNKSKFSPESKDVQTEKSNFKCYLCKKVFQTNRGLHFHTLAVHIRNHSDNHVPSSKGVHEHKREVQKKPCKKCNLVFSCRSNAVFCQKCKNSHGKFVASQPSMPVVLQKPKKSLQLFSATNQLNVSTNISGFKTASVLEDGVNFPKDRSAVVRMNAKFKCIKCGKLFKEFTDVSRHVCSYKFSDNCEAVNDEDIIWVCRKCSCGFKYEMEFESHKEACTGLPKKKSKTADSNSIKSGKKSNALNKEVARKISKSWPQVCACRSCDKTNLDKHPCAAVKVILPCKVVLKRDFLRYENKQISVSDYVCKYCQNVFFKEDEYILHLEKCKQAEKNDEVICICAIPDSRTSQSSEATEPPSSENVGCGQQQKNSSGSSDRLSHSLKCICCGGVFVSKKGFERHVGKHHSSNTSFCSDCKTSFDGPLSFQLHRCNRASNSTAGSQENIMNSENPSNTSNTEASSSDHLEVVCDDDDESNERKPNLEPWLAFCESTDENNEITTHEPIYTKVEITDTPSNNFFENDISQNSSDPPSIADIDASSSAEVVEVFDDCEPVDIKPNMDSLLTSERIEDILSVDFLEKDSSQNSSQKIVGNTGFGDAVASTSSASCVQHCTLSAQNSSMPLTNSQRYRGHHQKFPSQASRRGVSSTYANRAPGARNMQIPNGHQQSNYLQFNHSSDFFSDSNPSGVNNFPIFQQCEVINLAPQEHVGMYRYFPSNTSGCMDPQQSLKSHISSRFSTRNTPQNERNKCQNVCNYRNGYRQPRAVYPSSNQTNFSRLNNQQTYRETGLHVRSPNFHINNSYNSFYQHCGLQNMSRNSLTVGDFHEGRHLDSNMSSSSLVSESSESSNSDTSTARETPIISDCWSVGTPNKRPTEPVIPLQEVEVVFIKDDMHSDAYAVVNKAVDSKSVKRFICKNCHRSSFSTDDLINHLKKTHDLKIERELKVTEL